MKLPDFDNPLLAGLDKIEPYSLVQPHILRTLEPPPMIITDVLPAGGIMGITSFPGVGKSWLTMEVVRAVSGNFPFLGHFETLAGSALFVGSDSSDFDYARQWTRLTANDEKQHNSFVNTLLPEERTHILTEEYGPDHHIGPFHSARFLLQSGFMLDNIDSVRKLIRTCLSFEYGPMVSDVDEATGERDVYRRTGFRVIIFDTLSKLTHANQNDNTEMENVFRNIRLIAETTGAAIILLHHNSKKSEHNSGEDWRGAMSQIGALDSWIQLHPIKGNKHIIKVQYKKFRGITPADFEYQMNVNDPKTASLFHLVPVVEQTNPEMEDAIYSYLIKQKNPVKVKDIAAEIANEYLSRFPNGKRFREALLQRLDTLVEDKTRQMQVNVKGGGKPGAVRYYWATKRKEAGAQAEPEASDQDE